MTDLGRQVRILHHLYESFNKNKQDSYPSKKDEDLSYIPDEQLRAELRYLIESGYINNTAPGVLTLSVKGVETIESLCRKFMAYIRKNYATKLSYWINVIDVWKSNTYQFVSQVFFVKRRNLRLGMSSKSI